MKKGTIILAVISAAIVACAPSYAATDLTKALDLSPSQVKQIREQRNSGIKAQERYKEQIRVKEQQLKQEMAKDTPDQTRIRAMVQEINRLRSSAFEQKVNSALAAKKVLNREQLRKLEQYENEEGNGNTMQYRHRQGMMSGNGGETRKGAGGK